MKHQIKKKSRKIDPLKTHYSRKKILKNWFLKFLVNTYLNVDLDYTFNDEDHPERFYYRSDHYNFAKNNIPIIFYFSGTHEDYHKPTDTPDKIQYDLLELRTKLIFHTAWELANRNERIKND